jgi:hypothetical protein
LIAPDDDELLDELELELEFEVELPEELELVAVGFSALQAANNRLLRATPRRLCFIVNLILVCRVAEVPALDLSALSLEKIRLINLRLKPQFDGIRAAQ